MFRIVSVSVCLYCALLPPAFFVIHPYVIVLVVTVKTIKTGIIFFCYAEVLNQMCAYTAIANPMQWYSSLRCVLTACND